MRAAALVWWLGLAAPYWEAKPPREWTADELARMFSDSPWAQVTTGGRSSALSVPVPVFLATAEPLRQAEAEARRRAKVEPDPDYLDFLAAYEGRAVILAVRIDNFAALSDAGESRRMETESILRIGRKKLRLLGHFPPSQADPHLRLVFPRQVSPEDRKLVFEIYVPGVPGPYRAAEFALKDLICRGAPAF